MNDSHDPNPPSPYPPEQQPPMVLPYRYPPPPRPRSSFLGTLLRGFFIIAFAVSIGINFIFFASRINLDDSGSSMLYERYHSGNKSAKDKIAILRLDGVLMEGATSYAQKQIEKAAKDKNIKAIVLRIVSPGGSITASDDLYKRLKDLHEDLTPEQKCGKVKMVVSMGSVAASGGYYIAMPGDYLIAERTSITGSIGVYASFPNVTELADKYGFKMNTIKAGDVKDSGSMFHEMKPEERMLWQNMVDHAYLQFLGVVEEGRPKLKGKLQEDLVIDETVPVRSEKQREKHLKYTRYRADGGIFTADQAKQYGLIDEIGYLQDAIKHAKRLADSANPERDDYQVVVYDRPSLGLLGSLLNEQSEDSSSKLDPKRLAQGAIPRLWYLAPQSDLAGILASLGRE